MLNTLIPGIVRTLVPALVSALIALGLKWNLHIDEVWLENVLTLILTGVLTGIYYVGVRLLERFRSSKWGWLLGYPAQPVYEDAKPEDLEADFHD